MKIPWKQFAKRRGLTMKMFKKMEYQNYVTWCRFRNVVPLSVDEFNKEDKASICQ